MSKKGKIESPKLERFFNLKFSFNDGFNNINRFVKHLNPIIEKANKEDQENIIRAIQDAYKEAGIDLEHKTDVELSLTNEQKKIVYKSLKLPELISPDNDGHLWKSNFILLISSFEYLISDIISFYYKFYPKSALDKNIEVNLKSLSEFESLEDFIDDLISKRVEALLYKSFKDQLEFIKKELKIDIEERIVDWDLIKEATLRRHLIVHNNSQINKRYLTEANKEYSKDLSSVKEGERVMIGKTYFDRVYQEFFVAGQIIIQNCWRKWLSEFDEVANADLIDMTFKGNIDKNFIISEKIGLYGKSVTTLNNDFRFRINVNYCLALKGQNKTKLFEEEISKIDISNLAPILVLAYHALQDDCKNSLLHIKNAKTVDKLEFDHVMTWPLFENLRADEGFIQKVSKIYRRKPIV